MNSWLNAALMAEICQGQLLNKTEAPLSGFSIDTRTLKTGNVFVALQGENSDGHNFCEAAVQSGAAALLVSRPVSAPENVAVIVVNDTLTALQNIAAFRRRKLSAICAGVTGSNGKTTTRAMLQHLLSASNRVSATRGNLNNHIGLPLTILDIDEKSEFAILEMGMNHLDEIRELCRIAAPDASLISNIGPAHIGNLGSLENIARAKAEILEHLNSQQFAVVPGDTEFTEIFRTAGKGKILTFGEKAENDYIISSISMNIDSISFQLTHGDQQLKCNLPLSGRHNAFNATAALAMFHQLGFSLEDGLKHFESFTPVGARMEKVQINGVNIILDCYNANPGSMQEALKFLSICPAPRIAVLGDMRELGDLSGSLHEELGAQAAQCAPELLLCVGEDARSIASGAINAGMPSNQVISLMSNDETAEIITDRLKTGTTILFKASRGMHFEKIVRKIWPQLGKDLH